VSDRVNDDRLSHDATAERVGCGVSAAMAAALNPPASSLRKIFIVGPFTVSWSD
jgi:hypothetical protein